MSLKNYLDERGRKFAKRELTLPISPEGADARRIWKDLRSMFISKHEDGMCEDGMCQEITIKLYVDITGRVYYEDSGRIYRRLIEKDIIFPEMAVKIILQLAKEDGIVAICKRHQSLVVFKETHVDFYGDEDVYEFTYIPPSKENT